MFSRKFISMGVKGLAKLNTFIAALCIARKKMQYIVLIVHCFHPLISEEHWGLLLILDIKVGITFMKNKHYILVINITMMLQRKPLELSKSLRNQIIPFCIKPMIALRKDKKTYPKIAEALARITHLIGKQGIAYRGN